MIKTRRERGAALIVVLALVAMMVILVVMFFSSTSSESAASQHQADAAKAQQLASSAAQMVIAQIQDASTRTMPGAGNAVAWTSQPGLLRTFTPSGPSTVFKLYSAGAMSTDSFAETDDIPPADWKSSPALFCDINAPVPMAGSGRLSYPVADPVASGVVPGFEITGAPGYNAGGTPAPDNNPLPMPVRWLYILKDGQIAVPESVATNGTVLFLSTSPQPSALNPVVGRTAFWTDDETCKVNINTAGYARNDSQYWTYWDTPVIHTQEENTWLSWMQPWKNEFQRYPGHPATTGLNVVFDSLNLTDTQTLALTPFYRDGGTRGGTERITAPPSTTQIEDLLKDERIFPTVDEMFYSPSRGAQSAGISAADLEARRFLLTATSRAPETTLFDTPRVTIWPTWQTEAKRTSIDRLIAFCSTIAGEPFYFVRENPFSTRELLDIPGNLALWQYLQTLGGRNIPGYTSSIRNKFGEQSSNQILTSIWDAIRLTNIDDRTPPASGSVGHSFTAGTLSYNGTTQRWSPTSTNYTAGFVAPTEGPDSTRGAGRAAALQEVTFLFARTSNSTDAFDPPRDLDSDGSPDRRIDNVKAAVLYSFWNPSAGMVQPGQRRSIVVEGLSGFRVRPAGSSTWQQLFTADRHERTERDGNARNRYLGARIEHTLSVAPGQSDAYPDAGSLPLLAPPTANVTLPYNDANPNSSLFEFSGGTLTVKVYYPDKIPGNDTANLYQTYSITFPPADALSPMPVPSATFAWVRGGRWQQTAVTVAPHFETRYSARGDTLLSMQNRTGDFRSEVLRTGTIGDFRPHARYGLTNLPTIAGLTDSTRLNELARRASSIIAGDGLEAGLSGVTPDVTGINDLISGRLIAGFNNWTTGQPPGIVRPAGQLSIMEDFPPGDFGNGPSWAGDGSISPKADEGMANDPSGQHTPYFRNLFTIGSEDWVLQGTLASPNRQMPSALLFGMIPSGTGNLNNATEVPWRTLLFRPARSYHMGGTGHFGADNPPDYLMLDWFHMPIVEPYAISEPFSTAGKVNLNAKIVPFGGYLRRETALHAVLDSARIAAIPESVVRSGGILPNQSSVTAPSATTRYPIDVDETLSLLRERFTAPGGSNRHVYLTAGEICSVDLVPEGFTAATLPSFWANKRVTGDNLREQPYSSLVPRLTARSNSYTVHVTAQVLKPAPGVVGWQEGRGAVAGEWRGAITLERYVDPNDQRFDTTAPDFLSGTEPVGPYYKFRILGTRRFNP